jgi:hypothetical protein
MLVQIVVDGRVIVTLGTLQVDAEEQPSDIANQRVVVDVAVVAVKHPDGFAVARVHLEIDEVHSATDDNDPWVFEQVSMAPGAHTLVAVAEDWSGNQVASAPVVIGFGEVEWGETESTDTGGESDDDADAGTAGNDGGGSACSCATSTRADVPLALLLWMMAGLLLRRRNRGIAS